MTELYFSHEIAESLSWMRDTLSEVGVVWHTELWPSAVAVPLLTSRAGLGQAQRVTTPSHQLGRPQVIAYSVGPIVIATGSVFSAQEQLVLLLPACLSRS